MTMYNFTSDNVNVGDKVIIYENPGFSSCGKVGIVEKKSPKGLLTVSGEKYKRNGEEYGGYGVTSLGYYSEEEEKRITEANRRRVLLKRINQVNWYSVDSDKLEKVLEIVG